MLSIITDGLGEHYRLMETSYKMVASPYSAQGCLQAFDEVVRENDIAADEIEAIEIVTSPFTIRNVGVIVEPEDVLEAHFSTAFGCAVRLFRGGNGVYDYRAEDLRDERFLDIARRVRFTPDEAMEADRVRYNSRPATARVTLRRRAALRKERAVLPRHAAQPGDERGAGGQVHGRGRTPRLGKKRAGEIVDKVWALEALEDVGELVRLTVRQ